ncbi:putative beta-sarcoglycan [Apostichopus japonicus]|uniref:Beta-sarcoglycan n=1 Tax=Stichopus japonicus TaxID=307972 RepID=A0A2G8KL57_STIJA|nr:putative beta-sarcoglycan [Apostichopus japonicus]
MFSQDDSGKPSMLEKSLERRRINREHNSNFRAGHVAVHEAHLHKTGLRGRKGYLAVCFLMCLILVAVVNFMLTLWIMFGVQINRHGSNLFDFLVDGTLRFKVPTDLQSVQFLTGGVLGGFEDRDLAFSSNDGNVTLQQGDYTKVVVSSRETLLQGNSFEVINPFTGNTVFDTGDKKNLKFQPGTKIRSEGGVEVSKIVSPTGKGLHFRSEGSIEVHGKEGGNMRARKMNLFGKNIELSGISSINLISQSSSSSGIYLNTSLLIPDLVAGPRNQPGTSNVYRLCLCGNNGRLFGARVRADTINPCQELEETFDLCN